MRQYRSVAIFYRDSSVMVTLYDLAPNWGMCSTGGFRLLACKQCYV
jgi:hypothetical protein